MNNSERRTNLLCAIAAIATLLSVSTEARAEKPDAVPSPPKPVIVENPDPIAIEGEVNATVNGTVPVLVENTDPIPVDGSVLVANPEPIPVEGDVLVINPDPISVEGEVNAVVTGIVAVENFDTKIDALKSEVGQLNSEVQRVREAVEGLQGSERETWTYVWQEDFDAHSRAILPTPGPGIWQDTELIVISSEDDSITVSFWQWTNNGKTIVFKVGALNDEFPTVQSFNLPQPVDFDEVDVFCWNTFEDCEVVITMVGSKPAP